jgi:ABC-type multidrug transport system ATPase subunit
MRTCSACRTENADANRYCQQCGRALDAVPEEVTVKWRGGVPLQARPPRRDITVGAVFGDKTRLVIGRAPDCDVSLPHPMISRYHALLERVAVPGRAGDDSPPWEARGTIVPRSPDSRREVLRLTDLASVNGVTVDGRRITEPVILHEGVRVGIGPFLFNLRGGVIHSVDSSRSLRLEAQNVEKVLTASDGKKRKLLDGVSLVVNPGEFVSLLGPSGSGKSTLMDCLNGRRRATRGRVLANGEDFYRHFDSFRQSLGYVPQRDIVHTQLTVYRALYYTARLRLPTDTDPAELKGRIEEVVRLMELGPSRDTLVGDLSGGQIKRVSLGAELLAQPSLLYIDEATSGLDAGTEARMMRLFRRLADEGRSIVCITHNVDNVDQCHLIIVLARGRLVYYGPPAAAPNYFHVKRISEIYDRIGERDAADWVREFEGSPFHREYVKERQDAVGQDSDPASQQQDRNPAPPQVGPPLPAELSESRQLVGLSKQPPRAQRFREVTARYLRFREWLNPLAEMWHQFRVLTGRYVELILSDRRGLRLLVLQAPMVGLFLVAGFIDKKFREPMPFPRELKPEERRALAALQTLTETDPRGLLDGELTREQRQALEKIEFDVRPPNAITGAQVVRLIKQLPRDVGAMSLLEKATLYVDNNGETVALRGAPLVLLARLIDSSLPKTITDAEAFRALRNLKNLNEDSDEVKRLKKTKLEFKRDDKPLRTSAAEVLTVLHALEHDGAASLRKSLSEATMRVQIGSEKVEFTAEDLRRMGAGLRESRIPERLLAIKGPVVPEREGINPRYTYILLFLLVMIVMWFGCNNAAKEIVKEEAIYGRERAVNLGIVPYLASKFLVMSLVTAFHSLVLLAILFGPLELLHHLKPDAHSVPDPSHMLGYPALYGVLVLLSMTGVALGLLLSACVATPDRANALLPYVLIPQIILGGGFLDVSHGVLHALAQWLSPVYWAYRAVHLSAQELPRGFPGRVDYADNVALPCEALLAQCAALMVLTWWFMRRKDV